MDSHKPSLPQLFKIHNLKLALGSMRSNPRAISHSVVSSSEPSHMLDLKNLNLLGMVSNLPIQMSQGDKSIP